MAQQITIIDKATHTSKVVTGNTATLSAWSVVDLPLSHAQVKSLARSGSDLVVTMTDGDTIVIHRFFADGMGDGRNDLVLKDGGGLWLADLADMHALPIDTSLDPALGSVFSPIDSTNPLLAGAASPDTASASGPVTDTTPDTATASTAVGTADAIPASGATDTVAAGATGTAADMAANTVVAAGPENPLVAEGALNWLPLLGGIGILAGAITSGRGSAPAPVSTTSTTPTQTPHNPINGVSETPTTDGNLLTVTGYVNPGDTVKVTFPDSSTATATADSSGHYIVSSSTTETGAGTITMVNTGTSGSSTHTWNWDAPVAPTAINYVANSDGGVTVTGAAGSVPANSIVTVTFPDGSTATGTADANGNYSVTTHTPQPDRTLSVTETDAGNNTSAPMNINYSDTTPPLPPANTAIKANPDGGLTVTGTAEIKSTVSVTFPDGSTGVAATDSSGHYSVTTHTPQTSGTVQVTATDLAGNVSKPASPSYTDTTAPVAPAVGIAVNPDGTITVMGGAEAGSKVTVTYPDSTSVTTYADAHGSYSVTSASAQTSGGTVAVTATDAAGNQSQATDVTYTVGTAVPYASINYVTANHDGGLTVNGTAQTGTTVTVTYPDGSTATGTVDANGDYSITTHAPQTTGAVQVTAADGAGHVSTAASATYTDTTPPQIPSVGITANSDGGITVAGSAEAGSTVTVTYPDSSTATGAVDANGHYTITTHTAESSGTVAVTVTDAAGNTSNPTSVSYTAGVSDPAYVSVTSVTANPDGGLTVMGNTEAGSTVTVTYPDGSTATVTADANTGHYTLTTDVPQPSGAVQAAATDAAGNSSPPVAMSYSDNDPSSHLTINPDTGTNPADLITANGSLTFSGTLAHVLSTVSNVAESMQISLDGGDHWNTATITGPTSWSYDNTANTLGDGVYIVETRILDGQGNPSAVTSAQEVVVCKSGTLNLSLQDVLSDTQALGSQQHVMIGSDGGVVSSVALAEGVGSGTGQWQDTGTAIVGGITYDVYHNVGQTTTAADLLIQHGITVN